MNSLDDSETRESAWTMEKAEQCPLCADSEARLLYVNRDRLFNRPGEFGIVQCTRCFLVRLSPRPTTDAIQNYYPQNDYYSYQTKDGSVRGIRQDVLSKGREWIRNVVLGSLGYPVSQSRPNPIVRSVVNSLFFTRGTYGWGRKFPRYVREGKALDVGSGNGRFLSYLKEHGWDVQGLDFSQTAADFAKREFDIDVRVGIFEEVDFQEASFDHINLSHVVEHTYDPVLTVEIVKRLLKPGGTAYVEVPNFSSFGRKWCGRFWYPWETPRHLYMFSPDNLVSMIESVGLLVERIETQNGNFWPWYITYKHEESAGNMLPDRPRVAAVDKPRLWALRILAALSKVIRPDSGDFICCWIRKPA